MDTIDNFTSFDFKNNCFDTDVESPNIVMPENCLDEVALRNSTNESAENNSAPSRKELEYKQNPKVVKDKNYLQVLSLFRQIQSEAYNFSLMKLDKVYASDIINYCYELELGMYILNGEYKLIAQELVDGSYNDKIQEYGLLIKSPKSLASDIFQEYIHELMIKYDRYCCVLGMGQEVVKLYPNSCETECELSKFTVSKAAKVFTTLQFEYYKENHFQWKGIIENEHLLRIHFESKISG